MEAVSKILNRFFTFAYCIIHQQTNKTYFVITFQSSIQINIVYILKPPLTLELSELVDLAKKGAGQAMSLEWWCASWIWERKWSLSRNTSFFFKVSLGSIPRLFVHTLVFTLLALTIKQKLNFRLHDITLLPWRRKGWMERQVSSAMSLTLTSVEMIFFPYLSFFFFFFPTAKLFWFSLWTDK